MNMLIGLMCLVMCDGMGHNPPRDVVKVFAEHWFRLCMHPTREPLPLRAAAAGLDESVRRNPINAIGHKGILGAD